MFLTIHETYIVLRFSKNPKIRKIPSLNSIQHMHASFFSIFSMIKFSTQQPYRSKLTQEYRWVNIQNFLNYLNQRLNISFLD